MLPLFQDWTFATLASLPSVSSAPHIPVLADHRCQRCQELMSIVRRLTFQLQALQTEVHRTFRATASTPPSPTPARTSTPIGAHPKRAVLAVSLHLHALPHHPSPLLSASTLLFCRALLCTSPMPPSVPRVTVTLTVTVAGALTTASLSLSQTPCRFLTPCSPALPHMQCSGLLFGLVGPRSPPR